MRTFKDDKAAMALEAEAFGAAEARRLIPWMAAKGWEPGQAGSKLDLAARDHFLGRTLLGAAALAGDVEAVEALLPGSDVDAAEEDGATPLMLGARSGVAGAVRALLAAGADPSAHCEEGWDALRHAAIGGRVECARLLIGPCDPKSRDRSGMTALMCAALSRSRFAPDCVDALLPASEIEARDASGLTAAGHAAAEGRHEALARIKAYALSARERLELDCLLAAGAAPARSSHGRI